MHVIDCLQYCNWSEKIFRQMREGGVDAVHVTIAYHENFRETVANVEEWNRWFERFPELIFQGRTGDDVRRARRDGRTAIFFGFQNPSPIEDDIGLVEICHTLGARFMQLTYNNQSLLATGCYEEDDTGLTRMGRAVVAELRTWLSVSQARRLLAAKRSRLLLQPLVLALEAHGTPRAAASPHHCGRTDDRGAGRRPACEHGDGLCSALRWRVFARE
ncbi:MAG: membrane dipeptidase, partial [Pseudomonadota bacterium]|nr:membrane dipeptidase [Pseudomonadota bacterium]